jgi:hypothetical protein
VPTLCRALDRALGRTVRVDAPTAWQSGVAALPHCGTAGQSPSLGNARRRRAWQPLELSEAEVAEIKSRRNGAWELTTAAPTPSTPADETSDEEASEPTSSEASLMAAEAAEAEALDAPARSERVQRRRLR